MSAVLQDLRYGLRALRRAPAFTLFVVVTLALGVAASTITFAIVDAVLVKPLPFRDPQRLAIIRPDSGSRLSERYASAWRSQSRTTVDLAGWYDDHMILSGREEPIEVRVDRTTPNFFTVLGTPPLLGRTFSYSGDLRRVDREIVLGYGLWQRRFQGRPDIVGQSIVLDGAPFSIVGVMASGFAIRSNELPESRAELWVPFQINEDGGNGMGGALNVVARLAEHVSFEQVQAELATIANRLEAERPSYTRNWRVEVVGLREATVQGVRATLVVLFGSVGILLLIACVNVATLLLSRAASRSLETATRVSLGATRRRLVQQFLAEGVLLGVCGGSFGLLLAVAGTHLAVSRLSAFGLPRISEVSVDPRTLAFAFGVTTLTILAFGVLPALRATAVSPRQLLQHDSRIASGMPGRRRSRTILLTAQVALALTLLAGAGLLVRSFEKLSRVDLGFRPDHVVTVRTTLSRIQYDTDDRLRAFMTEVLARAAATPGLRAVGFANYLPLTNVGEGTVFDIEGRSYARPDEQPGAWRSVVGGNYFEAMGIPLRRGRLPGSADTDRTEPVVVIDEGLARRYWADANPVGARLIFKNSDGTKRSAVVIGVVGNVRWAATAVEPPVTTYLWFPQQPKHEITLVSRMNGNAAAAAKILTRAITSVDGNQPVSDVRTLDETVADDLARPRETMLVLGGFALAAMTLAGLGLYSVIALIVSQRTREIGVRVALGAQRRDVLKLIMSHGLIVTATGVAIGIVCTIAVGRLLAGLLYEIAPRDPITLIAAAAFMLIVGTVAMYLPASRATRLDPVVALRRE